MSENLLGKILVPSEKEDDFLSALENYYTSLGKVMPKVPRSEIPCDDANNLIKDYQKRLEVIHLVKTGDEPDYRKITLNVNMEKAYSLVDTIYLAGAIIALEAIGAVKIRSYFSLNTAKQTTIAILGEGIDGEPLMPEVNGVFIVYENFGGGGTISSIIPDLPCRIG